METQGRIAPGTESAAREEYAAFAGPAETVTRAVARVGRTESVSDGDDADASPAVTTAHDALFASLLTVHVGRTGEFESWVEDAGLDPDVIGSEHVDRVAWHPVAFAGTVAGATFQSEPEAAVATLRRRAFGEYYRPVVRADGGDGPDGGSGGATA